MAYTRVNWQNSPSHATPLSAENLNVMDEGIYDLDAAITEATGDIADLETTVSGHTTSIQTNTSNISTLQTTVSGHTSAISGIEGDIGDLSELETTTKTDLVSAINELSSNTHITGTVLYFE